MAPAALPAGWTLDDERQRLMFETKLDDFLACVDAVHIIAEIAEAMDHHPDVHIEGYNTLRIETYTHTEGKVTDKDHALAAAIAEKLVS